MKIRRFGWAMLVLALLLVLSCFLFVACKDPVDPVDPVGPVDPVDPVDPEPPVGVPVLSLIANGASEYRIVYSDFATDAVRKMATNVRKALNSVTGVKLDIVTDWENRKDNANIKEILIGETNRAESKALQAQLDENGYGFSVSGNKVMIVGKNESMLSRAVNLFLATYVGYRSESDFVKSDKVEVPENMNMITEFNVTSDVAFYVTNPGVSYLDALVEAVKPNVESLTVYQLGANLSTVFNKNSYGLVVIVGADRVPNGAKAAIQSYLNGQGRVLFIGGPIFETTLTNYDGNWLPMEEAKQAAAHALPCDTQRMVLNTSSNAALSKFRRVAQDLSGTQAYYEIGDFGLEESKGQLKVELSNVKGWDTIAMNLNMRLDNEVDAICFYAKSGRKETTSLGISVSNSEGSWVAKVTLTEEWQHYVIPVYEFSGSDNTPVDSHPDLTNIARMDFGYSPQACSAGGTQIYYLADVSACYHGFDRSSFPIEEDDIQVNAFSPMFELYPITNGETISAYDGQIFVKERDYVLPEEVFSCYAQRQALGYTKGWSRRFVPLIQIKDYRGLNSGYAAWMMLNVSTTTANNGSIIGCFSSVSEDFYDENGIAAIVDTVKAMTRHAYLIEGGVDEYTYVEPDQDSYLAGASVSLLRSQKREGLTTVLKLYDGDKLIQEFITNGDMFAKGKQNSYFAQKKFSFADGKPTSVVASLMLDGEEIDRITHDIFYWSPKPETERHYIYREDGYFKQDGKILNFFGVNFAPSYKNGLSSTGRWYCNTGYDPTVIADDLARLKDIGINAIAMFGVSVDSMRDGNAVIDFIRRCDELGIYVDVSIEGDAGTMYPLMSAYNPDVILECMERMHFAEMDNIIAYDISWEERVGTYLGAWTLEGESNTREDATFNWPGFYVGRKNWDDDWAAWIDVQYGSLANAEKAWNCKLTMTPDGYPYISNAMMDDTTGIYDEVLDAYYRFVDDIVARQMQDGMNVFRAADPNHLFSFRMSMSGSNKRTGSSKPSTFYFDFQSLASTMDVMEPEGYALTVGFEQVEFANAYARYAAPNAPVVWKEYGVDIWTGSNFTPNEGIAQAGADYYEQVYSHCLRGYTSGLFAWWSVSGYRIDEGGNCSIMNPDGSDHPVTKVMRKYAPLFINQGECPKVEAYIEVERDNQLGGVFGLYDASIDKINQYISEGKFFAFVDGSMTDQGEMVYADTVCEAAVGDASVKGITYPLRYVNGMVKDVVLTEKDGKTIALITVCNTKQSIWRAGTVSLVSYKTSDIEVNVTIDQDVSYLEDVTLEVPISGTGSLDLRFEIKDIEFGPLYSTEIK